MFRSKSPRNYKEVLGRGNEAATTLMIGEKPGQEELYRGKVWVGKGGAELDKIAWKVGVDLNGVWLDNLLNDAPTGDDWSVTDEDISRNLPRILDLFDRHRFDTVVAMGAVANRFFLGSVGAGDGHVRTGIGTSHGLLHKVKNQWGPG